MKRYRCTKTCQYAGRVFKDGDIYLSDSCKSPFFERVGEFGDAEGDIKMNIPSEVIQLKMRLTRLEKIVETQADTIHLLMAPVVDDVSGEGEPDKVTEEQDNTGEGEPVHKTSGRSKK